MPTTCSTPISLPWYSLTSCISVMKACEPRNKFYNCYTLFQYQKKEGGKIFTTLEKKITVVLVMPCMEWLLSYIRPWRNECKIRLKLAKMCRLFNVLWHPENISLIPTEIPSKKNKKFELFYPKKGLKLHKIL